MNSRTKLVIALGSVGMAASTLISVANATDPPPRGAITLETISPSENALRTALGLGIPDLTEMSWIGPVRLTASEATLYRAYESARVASKETRSKLKNLPGVLTVSLGSTIERLSVTVHRESGEPSPEFSKSVSELEGFGYKVAVKDSAVSAEEFFATRDFLSVQVGGIDKDIVYRLNIDGRPRIVAQSTDPAASIRATLRSFQDSSIKITGAYFSDVEPLVTLKVANTGSLGKAKSLLPESLKTWIRLEPGSEVLAQAAGPWPGGSATFSGRLDSSSTIARGGKRMSNGCTSGPVVRSTFDVDYVTSAGHCNWTSTTQNVGGAQLTFDRSCDTFLSTTCSPFTYGGVDAAVLGVNPGSSATGWFVWQEWMGNQPIQQTSRTDSTVGNYDLEAGVPLICIEGASEFKYGTSISASSSCGIAQGWTSSGFYYLHMYPLQPICHGDSGAYIRRPTGNGGSYNSGIFRGWDLAYQFMEVENGQCMLRPEDTPYALEAVLTTFWKFHSWYNFQTGRVVWGKTW